MTNYCLTFNYSYCINTNTSLHAYKLCVNIISLYISIKHMKSLNIKLIVTIIALVDKTIKIQKHNFFNLINLFFVLIKRNINIYF